MSPVGLAGWDRLVWGQAEDAAAFARRVFWTSAAMGLLFFNPYVQSSMTWNFLDLAISLVETGRPFLAHTPLYRAVDTARTPWGFASAEPLGPSLPLLPLWGLCRLFTEPSPAAFMALNALAILLVSVPAAALTAVLTYRQACRYGGDERASRATAWLAAFGTQLFPHATMYTKELLGTVACLAGHHLAARLNEQERPPGPGPLLGVGALAAVAGLMVYPLWLLVPWLLVYLRPVLTPRRAAWLVAGAVPGLLLLLAYNSLAFGSPLVVGYLALSDPRGGALALPTLEVLWGMTLGPAGGTFFYHPVLLLGMLALWSGRGNVRARRDGLFAVSLLVALLLVYGAWLTPHYAGNPFIASLGLRMLLPAALLLVAPLATLGGRWPRLLAGLGVASMLSGLAFAAAGLVPGRVLPLGYVWKVTASTWAGGLLFADALPRYLGLETLHTALASGSNASQLLADPSLGRLLLAQAVFRAVSLAAALVLFAALAGARFTRGFPVLKRSPTR